MRTLSLDPQPRGGRASASGAGIRESRRSSLARGSTGSNTVGPIFLQAERSGDSRLVFRDATSPGSCCPGSSRSVSRRLARTRRQSSRIQLSTDQVSLAVGSGAIASARTIARRVSGFFRRNCGVAPRFHVAMRAIRGLRCDACRPRRNLGPLARRERPSRHARRRPRRAAPLDQRKRGNPPAANSGFREQGSKRR